MPVNLPKTIENYFTADRDRGADAVVACFTDDAVVRDEGKTHIGLEAIRQWKAGAVKKYTYTVEPFRIATENGKTLVTSHLVGDFPGSPVDLRYFFVLRDDKIAELEITV